MGLIPSAAGAAIVFLLTACRVKSCLDELALSAGAFRSSWVLSPGITGGIACCDLLVLSFLSGVVLQPPEGDLA